MNCLVILTRSCGIGLWSAILEYNNGLEKVLLATVSWMSALSCISSSSGGEGAAAPCIGWVGV